MNKPCHERELSVAIAKIRGRKNERKRVKIATADKRYISFEARAYDALV